MDPITITLIILGALAGVAGTGMEIYKTIAPKIAAKRRQEKAANGEYTPYIIDEEDAKLIDPLPPQDRAKLEQLLNVASMAPDDFFQKVENVDLTELQKAAEQQPKTAEELGFPTNKPSFDLNQLMQGTDFKSQAESMYGKFAREEYPRIVERLVGQGQLPGRSSSFAEALSRGLGKNLEDIINKGSEHNLKRAQLLGGLGQKEKALDIGRAESVGRLGLMGQNQPFAQQQALAQLGLNQKGQNINQQQANQNAYLNLLGLGKGVPIQMQQYEPSLGKQLIGGSLGLGGTTAQLYGNQQQNAQLTNLLSQLNQLDKGSGITPIS